MWLQLHVAESQDYTRLREAIIQYDNATLKWSSTMMLGQDTGGPAPMEIKGGERQRQVQSKRHPELQGQGQRRGQEFEGQRKGSTEGLRLW